VTAGADAGEFATLDGGNSVRTRLDSGALGVPVAVNTDVTGTSAAPLLVAADADESGQSTGTDAIANAAANTDASAESEAVAAKAVSQSLRAAIESSAGASLRIQNALDNVGNFSPENMFHATASGIVTAPTGLKPDTGPGTLIFAPQSVPLMTDEADGALSSNVRWMVNENIRQAVVNVTPSGMGPISIQMGIESEQMNVSIIAAQGATREALDAMLPRLREQMMAQGYENVNVNVSDSRPDQSLPGENSRQYADSDARDERTAESPFADFSTSGERAMRPDRHRGLFDVYV
jgi:flagellar hook-length control protein FliK